MTQRVFLSHSSEDKEFVREFDSILHGFGVVTFLDERDIAIGEDIPQRLYKELSEASHFLYFISSHSVCSSWVQEELSIAKMREKDRKGILILPILIEKLPELPPSIASKRYANFTRRVVDVNDRAFQLVLQALGVASPETVSANATITASKVMRQIISSILLVSAELQNKLSDISFMLRFANETAVDGVSARRLYETKTEVGYRQVDIGLMHLFEGLDKLKGMTMLKPYIVDLRKRTESFIAVLKVLHRYECDKRPDADWLHSSAEAARYLQVGIGHIHELGCRGTLFNNRTRSRDRYLVT